MKIIDDFYLLSELCNDDLQVVATLIHICTIKPPQKLISSLESLKLHKYQSHIDKLLSVEYKELMSVISFVKSLENETLKPLKGGL